MRGIHLPQRTLSSVLLVCTSASSAWAGSGIHTAIPTIHGTRAVSLCAVTKGKQRPSIQQNLKAFQQAALGWNVEITLLPYRDSQQAMDDFRNGVCDLVNLTGAEAQPFNRFSSTLEAVGALPTSEHLGTVLQALALAKAGPLMRDGEFEVVSVWPAGARYLWVTDRALSTPTDLASHTLSTHSAPEPLAALASLTGMKAINGNSGLVADLWASADGEDIPNGYNGVLSLPLNQMTHQILARHSALPDDFGQQARQYAADHVDQLQALAHKAGHAYSKNLWIDLDAQQRSEWQPIYQQIRVRLRNDGIYDAAALTLMRKVRCALDSGLLECGGGALQVE